MLRGDFMSKEKQKSESDTMAAIMKKPSVFIVKATKDNEQTVYKKLNDARMTIDFVNKCRESSKKLRDNNSK